MMIPKELRANMSHQEMTVVLLACIANKLGVTQDEVCGRADLFGGPLKDPVVVPIPKKVSDPAPSTGWVEATKRWVGL